MSYEEIYNSKLMTAQEAVSAHIKSGDKIFLGGLGIADKVLSTVLNNVKNGSLEDISFYGNMTTNKIGLDDENLPADKFRYYSFFNGANERDGANNGVVTHVPLHLSRFEDYLSFVSPDVAVIPMTPPNEHGYCNIGPAQKKS